jgi:hypothetical protein
MSSEEDDDYCDDYEDEEYSQDYEVETGDLGVSSNILFHVSMIYPIFSAENTEIQ